MNNYTLYSKPEKKKPRGKMWLLLAAVTLIAVVAALGIGLMELHRSSLREEARARRDSTAVSFIQQHSRLYTAEVTARKNVTFSTERTMNIDLGIIRKDVNLPFSKTEAVIPVTVRYKAFIDLDRVTKGDIHVEGDTAIYITLPDPAIQETGVSIDHDHEVMKRQWLGKGLTYKEYQQMVRKAKDDVWNEITEADENAIIETAKVSATELLIPQLRTLGFTHIEVGYRKDFTVKELTRLKN